MILLYKSLVTYGKDTSSSHCRKEGGREEGREEGREGEREGHLVTQQSFMHPKYLLHSQSNGQMSPQYCG